MRKSVISVLAIAAVLGYGVYQKQAKAPNVNVNQPKISYNQRNSHHFHRFNKPSFKENDDKQVKLKPTKFVAGKETAKQKQFAKPLKFDKKAKASQMHMLPLDKYKRAQGSHIQLDKWQLPKRKRSPYLTVRPSGWHNYKYYYDGKTGWLFNRGHLVGYQFCGLDQDIRNMITQTAYVNQGSLKGMDDNNSKGQLFYENRLAYWIKSHPQDKLDYAVIPLYHGKELVPRQIKFYFVGFNKHGKKIRVNGIDGLTRYKGEEGYLTLDNISPNAEIDYKTGRAQIMKG